VRQCRKDFTCVVHGRRVCHAHVDHIATDVFPCDECGRYFDQWQISRASRTCSNCAAMLWPAGTQRFRRCHLCDKPMGDDWWRCSERMCRTVEMFYVYGRRRARLPGNRCYNQLVPWYRLADFLSRMAQPRTDHDREFAKRYD
jgi:hypothetical protein